MMAFIDVLSPTHMIVILVVALIFFGNRLPEVARSFGRAINEFKRGLREVESEIDETPAQPTGRLNAPTSGTLPQDSTTQTSDNPSETVPRSTGETEAQQAEQK